MASTRSHLLRIFQKQVEYLVPVKASLNEFQRLQFMRDDYVRVGIEKRSDKTMAGSRITDEQAIGFNVTKKFSVPPALP